jgi:hypothetical protein
MDNLTIEYVCLIHLTLNQLQIWENQSLENCALAFS